MSEEREKDCTSEMSLSEEKSVSPGSHVNSSVSVKSHQSKGEVPNFSEETPSATESESPGSCVFSSASVESHQSKGEVPNFSEETPSATKSESQGSHVNSSVSVKSHQSKGEVPNFGEKTSSATKSVSPGSHVNSSVSVKSHQSKGEVPNFSEETPSATESERPASNVYSDVKSHHSKGEVPNFNEETPSATKSGQRQKGTVHIGAEITRWRDLKSQKGMKSDVELATFLLNSHNSVQDETSDTSHLDIQRHRKKFRDYLFWIFQDLENKITTFLKTELNRFKKILKKENTKYFVKEFKEARCIVREAALDITLYFLRNMKQDELAGTLEDELVFIHQRQIKSNLKKRYQCLSEGIAKQGESTSLNKIYTDLYITQGCSEQVNTDHEVMQIESASRRRELPEEQVKYTNLFEQTETDKPIRTVLTKGVAGIGKSVSVQKFILDWAEGTANQDITFIFPLPFRELNLQENESLSLMDLVRQFFPETKGLNLTRNEKFKILFVLDGLDECRLPLKFTLNKICCDVTFKVPLDVLLTNLINGNLFSSALIWITTRPAAASKIPNECIHRVTEVRGFDDALKKEYFRKRFPDTALADRIIKHVVENKSLFIMCHIPVFCWISATVLQNILEDIQQVSDSDDTPKTLTQMYTHFFRFQIQQSSRKYDGQYGPDISWNRGAISSLGKLAFHQLQKNNLIFYDTDLESCGIDLSNASAYSGMCTQIFKEETGIRLGTTYCFVHMSIQEYTASVYAHLFLDDSEKNAFAGQPMEQEDETMYGLLKTAVDKALESDNGHLDLFLRFLLGLSLKSNRPLLRERSINLFYCLNELNDRSLVNDIQEQLNKGSLSSVELSPAQWSALAFVLVTSNEEREDFELQKFKKSDECLCRLELVVKNSKRALLNDCNLTEKSCLTLARVLGSDTCLQELNIENNHLMDSGVELLCTGLENAKKSKLEILRLNKCELTEESCSALASVLGSDSSGLRELDLSNNKLLDSGVNLLSAGLHKNSTLEILKLSNCSITEEGYKSLASALESNLSHLKELDLTGNDPGESGVKLLTDVQQQSNCKLTTLRFLSPAAEKALEYLTEVLGENLLFLRKLDLSKHKLIPPGMTELAAVLQDKHCKLQTLILNDRNHFTEEDCAALATAFISNPTNLEELGLSRSTLRDSGMRSISTLFENLLCRLIILKLSHIYITKEGCVPLASAFISNPSHLRELDLSGNKIEDFGVTEISKLLQNSECRLEKLRLSNCSITEEGYTSLASALESNPSYLIKLDLTGNDPGESGVKLLTDVPNCALKTLRLLKSPEAEKACQYVTGVVGTNPLLLRELNLSNHKLDDTKVKQLAALLEDKHCKLNILQLNYDNISERGCAALLSALPLNPLNLKELDLSGNQLKDTGIIEISSLLKNPLCILEKLKLSNCCITEDGYKTLASTLRSNPSHLIELDLTENNPGESGVLQLTDLLHASPSCCKLKTIRFLKSADAEEACDYLTEVLGKNPLLLTELDLSHNKLGDLNGQKLSALLMDSHSRLEKIKLNDCDPTENNYSALAAVLSCNTILKEMDLNNSRLLDSGVKQLCVELKKSKLQRLKLNKCELTEESCSALASVLGSDSSGLRELDLSNNKLQDSGVNLLSAGLHKNSTLEILKLSNCSITEEGYKSLASALESNPSHLKELDLTGNDPGESGVKLLTDVQQQSNCKLTTLRFLQSPDAEKAFNNVKNVLGKNPLLVRELNLSKHKLDDTKVKHLAALLEDKHCKLNTLQLNYSNISEGGCAALVSALHLNPSNLKELDLSGNHLGDTGIIEISTLLKNPLCILEKLKISDCCITEKGYDTLVSTLKSSPSHVIELDLTGNNPGESGVNLLIGLLEHEKCTLKTLRYLSPAAEEARDYLAKVLGRNPLLLKELDLSRNKLGDLHVEKLSALLTDSHSRVEKIKLNYCDLTEKNYSALAAVLSSNTILKEMDLNNSRLYDSGVKQLCDKLKKSKLQILKLSNCSITEGGYKTLASALKSNPAHLIELDLTGNDPGESGVKLLTDARQKSNCTLRFLKGHAEKAYQYVNKVQRKDPLLQKELNLSDHTLDDTKVMQLAALLKDKHCKLNILQLSDCGLTEKNCSALANILSSMSSLKELDISNNRLFDSGVKKIQSGLGNVNCKLEKLRMSVCDITEEGYKSLASALESNPSHLKELDLTGNDPGESGVKLLNGILKNPSFKLKTLSFLSGLAEEGFNYVKKNSDPLLLGELKLVDRNLDDTTVKKLAALLEDKHCKVKTLQLCKCNIKEKWCGILTSALHSNLSYLRELDLSGNDIKKGVMHLCDVLGDPRCKIENLWLRGCGFTDEDFAALSSAWNSSLLRRLYLTGNTLGGKGVENLCAQIKNSQTKLQTLELCGCSITEKQCFMLASALCSNPSYLRELYLSGNDVKNKGLEQLCYLLNDSKCKLEKLGLNKCNITDVGSLVKMNAVFSLKELDLSNNNIGDSKKKLSEMLNGSGCTLRLDSENVISGMWNRFTSIFKAEDNKSAGPETFRNEAAGKTEDRREENILHSKTEEPVPEKSPDACGSEVD
ncbi:uncharacterized protein LOC130411709 isoform X2 [Triplophysa dalaica]|uniref:uncharacterized protein LOC130411709 isoform X2 n=1 Tax=Triplophysa dalaica TaxID=1582913 RepID=UPI0024DF93A6|nr:uncharacterized protein LOC130411709 isoform X2 [Triplophysa dalaica]